MKKSVASVFSLKSLIAYQRMESFPDKSKYCIYCGMHFFKNYFVRTRGSFLLKI